MFLMHYSEVWHIIWFWVAFPWYTKQNSKNYSAKHEFFKVKINWMILNQGFQPEK